MTAVQRAFEGHDIRIVDQSGEPWFVAADVCAVLGLANVTRALSALDDDERNTLTISQGNRGNPNVNVISESGLYALIVRSNKPEAKAFRRWVTHEVLPAIRQTGSYSLPGISHDSKEQRKALTEQWLLHGATKRHHYANLTRREYQLLGHGWNGIKKADMSAEQKADLMVLEALETRKLVYDREIRGYRELDASLQETGQLLLPMIRTEQLAQGAGRGEA